MLKYIYSVFALSAIGFFGLTFNFSMIFLFFYNYKQFFKARYIPFVTLMVSDYYVLYKKYLII